ncbi:MAG TPA: 1-(5-phosphoribosyl)-5-[(5-phosphoribosylamino)methylideneamino]imidazole-4-carboxamide isomerase [Nitrospirales bacterium]|nr:1-(5-phosphoribosyl)-5-[(5-phosphoribosylamino)methylideneamino]imidazole-4-carboxamide isomerase [Nitrospirales bacterium]
MLVIPAIDLKDGRCVRLRQGNLREETVYSSDPASMARRWVEQGAALLHVVDLNGAVEGEPKNAAAIASILKAVSIPVQIGGGIRSLDIIERYVADGASRVVLGTAALQDRAFLESACRAYAGRIVAGVDARDGMVAVQGWTQVSSTHALDLIAALAGYPLAALIYTDIGTDGMLKGPNFAALRSVLERAHCPVIASGGIATVEDLRAIRALGGKIAGAIVGKALYDGKVELSQAIRAMAAA